MNCSDCGFENPEGIKFCGSCGHALRSVARCRSCGSENPPGFSFCGECGSPLTDEAERDPHKYAPKHLADKILQSKSAIEGERKQVTVLFADVKGSMDLQEQVELEAWHRATERLSRILAEGVHRFEGTVN